MELLTNGTNIILIVLGFGMLITIHEFGHFIAARWAGIRVEGFSVGMGPALCSFRKGIGFKWGSSDPEVKKRTGKLPSELSLKDQEETGIGETEYTLRILPLGGFVKMLGQEDADPSAVSSDPRSFGEKPIYKRMIVVSAGVIMNLLAAVILFVIAFMVGVRFESPTIGAVVPDSPAAIAKSVQPDVEPGLRPGDQILSIDGKPTRTFSDLMIASAMSIPDESLKVSIERPGTDDPIEFLVDPVIDENSGLRQIGVIPAADSTLSSAPELTSMIGREFEQAGGTVEDATTLADWRITRANDTPVATWSDMANVASKESGKPIALEWSPPASQSDAQPRELTLNPRPNYQQMFHETDAGKTLTRGLAGLVPLVQIAGIPAGGSNAQTLQPGDVVLSVQGVNGPRNAQFRQIVSANPLKTLDLEVLREGKVVATTANVNGDGLIGVQIMDAVEMPMTAQPIDSASLTMDGEQTQTPVATLGLLPRTRIDAIGATKVDDWGSMRAAIIAATTEAAATGTGAEVEMTWTLPLNDQPKETGKMILSTEDVATIHALGYQPPLPEMFFQPLQVTLTANGDPFQALAMGFQETWKLGILVYMTIDRLLFKQSVGVEQLHGPVGIVHVGSRVANRGFMYLVFFLAMISVNLAVLNFLPLPIVDGGLFLYLVYEKITGRPPSITFQNWAALLGLVLIGTLFITTFYFDLERLFT